MGETSPLICSAENEQCSLTSSLHWNAWSDLLQSIESFGVFGHVTITTWSSTGGATTCLV